LRAELVELPAARRNRYTAEHGLSPGTAALLQTSGLADRFDEAVAAGAVPADAAKWLTNEVAAWCNEHLIDSAGVPLSGAHLAELTRLVADGTLSTKLAREVLEAVLAGEGSPGEVVAARGLAQISDTQALGAIVDTAIAQNPDAAQRVRDGNAKAIGALVGAVMRATKGQANPGLVNQLLQARLHQAGER
jgi:aspartyl-tRNA(Asn)/glutamyl-tRNA(Gln) amidotransferase subunit B